MNDTKTDFRTRDDVTGTAGVPAPPGTSDHKLLFHHGEPKVRNPKPKSDHKVDEKRNSV